MNKKIFSVFILSFMFLVMNISNLAYAQPFEVNALLDRIAAAKGKQVVLINFYASWCPPCIEEIPHLMNIRKKYPKDKLTIIGINLDEDINLMKKFNDKMGINYETFHDKGSIQTLYQINSIPFNILYGKNGNIIHAEAGYTDEEKLTKSIEYGLK